MTPIKVLVIDDEFAKRALLRKKLKPQGYEVIESSNGRIALELLAKQPAVVFLNPGFSDVQGHAFCEMIRGWNNNVASSVTGSLRESAASSGRPHRRSGPACRRG